MGRLKKWRVLYVAVGCCVCFYFVSNELQNLQKVSSSRDGEEVLVRMAFDTRNYISKERVIGNGDDYTKHAFNIRSSDGIPVDRSIPDSRHAYCRNKMYNFPEGVSVSVVISFHNEARSALLRTIISVLNRSPHELLQEIILVDDYSNDVNDGRELAFLSKIKVIRNDRREGLIRSRMKGIRLASGSHIMFLDSHCEVNVGWMEPLLHVLMKHPKGLASPVIDIIDTETFDYRPSSGQLKGGFDWNLNFRWQPLTKTEKSKGVDPTEFFKSPVIPGGLFLVNKSWFEQIGGLNVGFDIWGAENIEISIKSWLCGGEVLGVPCSRVGHVFRSRHPYSFPLNGSMITYLRNSRMLAESWLEEYKQQFYDLKPQAKSQPPISIDGIVSLKKKLKCKPFQWFMDNIYPELKPLEKDALALGQLQQESLCLQSLSDRQNKTAVILAQCSVSKSNQEWVFSKAGQLHQAHNCLTVKSTRHKPKIYLTKCKDKVEQQWTRRRRMLISKKTEECLESAMDSILGTLDLILTPCRRKAYSQQWDFSVELQTWGDR